MILNMKTTYIFVYTYLLVQLNRKGHAHSSAKLNNARRDGTLVISVDQWCLRWGPISNKWINVTFFEKIQKNMDQNVIWSESIDAPANVS